MSEPDFDPIDDASWPDALDAMKDGFATQLNVYRVMAHHPDLLKAWAGLRRHVVRDTSLGPVRSEVVILRTGMHLGSDYEWAHHVSRARALGMSDARIASLKGAPDHMSPEDAILARAVDALMHHNKITPQEAENVASLTGKAGVMDLIATVGFYTTLGFILNSFDTPIDAPIRDELADRPLSAD